VPDEESEVSSEDSEGCPVAAAEPGGAELCSFAPLEVLPPVPIEDCSKGRFQPASGGAELCSFAPLEVSLPAAVAPGGVPDGFMVSAAKIRLMLNSKTAAVVIK
jgi:hypothetical protein